MSMTEQDYIKQHADNPWIITVWHALQPLKSTVSFMNSGAHPDDETSSMLAALGFRDGLALSFACANRGEGGQNDIGTETTQQLGVIRTAEMERAADRLNLNLYWLSESPDDSIFDFGFSKSGVETLSHWDRTRTLKRFVDIVRTERPDILCPTFLDVPGQHGHHRAMTAMALEVFDAAADPAFAQSELPPWEIKKLYLPAWSGAGDSYDDDLPPPAATLDINASGEDPITGFSYAQIAQQSRAAHRTQGMGLWVPYAKQNNWSLHLLHTRVNGPDNSITAGLPQTLAELAEYASVPEIGEHLKEAQLAIDSALAAFPSDADITTQASKALKSVRMAQKLCPRSAEPEVTHRLTRKSEQLSALIRIASRVAIRATLSETTLRPGNHTNIAIEKFNGNADAVSTELMLPRHWQQNEKGISLHTPADVSDPYPAQYSPQLPQPPAVKVTVRIHEQESVSVVPLNEQAVVLPDNTVNVSPQQILLNTAAPNRTFKVHLEQPYPDNAATALVLPDNWVASRTEKGFNVTAPDNIAPGLYEIPVTLNNLPSHSVSLFEFPHIEARAHIQPACSQVRVMHADIPQVRIAYVGGGNDNVLHQLDALGLSPVELSDEQLSNASELDSYDTLVVGLFTMRTRPVLLNAMPMVHEWIRKGGNLVTLYHRPWDAWNPESVPPRPLSIGKPSLRWRVTNENATVAHLLPDHPLLNIPNKITEADWDGWHKERGLYFAMQWDDAYHALLSMHDPDESALEGALLSARIGLGRHTHTSLILHHQMEKLVPGAFRLMANLVAKGD